MTITPASGHDLPETVNVVGATASYDSTTGVISLSEPTGNVTITATCPEETPTPSLTPFSVGQDLTGAKAKFDTSVDPTSFLEGLTYDQETGTYELVSSSRDGGIISAASFNGVYMLGVDMEQQSYAKIVYASAAFPEMGITEAGWQSTLDENGEVEILTGGVVDEVAPVADWNGVFVGVVVGQAPALTPFSSNQTISGFVFANGTTAGADTDMDTFLAGLTYDENENSMKTLLTLALESGENESAFYGLQAYNLTVLSQGQITGYALIGAIPGVGDVYLYSTVQFEAMDEQEQEITVLHGYNNLTNGEYALASSRTVDSISDTTPATWNGVLIGADAE